MFLFFCICNNLVHFTFTVEVSFGVSPWEGKLGWKGSQKLNDVGNVIWEHTGRYCIIFTFSLIKDKRDVVKQTFLAGECGSWLGVKQIVSCGQLKSLQFT